MIRQKSKKCLKSIETLFRMVCNAEAVLDFYFLMGILIKSWLGVEVAFNGKFSVCY